MEDSVVGDGVECGLERQFLIDAEPLAGVPVPLNIEAVRRDPVEPDEGCIEFLAAIVPKARAVTLHEAVFAPVPFSLNIDRVVELRRRDGRQEARLQDRVDKRLAGGADGGFFAS